ncbi:MAG: glycosyltransferase [Bauldia sp.]
MSSVGVIVPCYNYGRYLRECVESVLTQSHQDLRVLIIDDASTDGTAEIAAGLAAADSRVAIRRHAGNRGHIATYNEGIDIAEGDYMLILSADDYLLPGAVARAVAVLDGAPDVGLAHGICILSPDQRIPRPAAVVEFFDSVALLEALAIQNRVCTPTAFVRTAVQKKLGYYRPDLPHAGDLEMWVRFAMHGRVASILIPQAGHRRHGANMSLRYDSAADLEQCIEAFRPHLRAIGRQFADGRKLEARLRRTLAERARRRARREIARGRVRVFSRLAALWLGESLAATRATLAR